MLYSVHLRRIGPGTPELNFMEGAMSPSTTRLLSSVYEAVRDLEEIYGPEDEGWSMRSRFWSGALRLFA
jgi:hypothetical protein